MFSLNNSLVNLQSKIIKNLTTPRLRTLPQDMVKQ